MDTPRGVATSEFWIAVSPWILALVVLLGLIFDAVDPDTSLALIGLLGIGGAFFAYTMRPGLVSWAYERAQFAHRVLDAKYYVDEIYDFVFIRGSIMVGKVLYELDRWVVDGAVNMVGFAGESLGHALKNLQNGSKKQ